MICGAAAQRAQLGRRRAPRTSRPSKRTVPGVGSISRSTSRPTVDLPQPDSPTSASVSPASTVKRHAVDRAHHGRSAARSSDRAHDEVLDERPSHARGAARAHATSLLQRRLPAARDVAVADARRAAAPRAGSARRRTGSAAAKRQPAAGLARLGTHARRSSPAARAARRAAGSSRAGRPCRDAAAAKSACDRRRARRSRPAYITATSSQISATTPRSWVMRMIAMPRLRAAARAAGRGSAPGS